MPAGLFERGEDLLALNFSERSGRLRKPPLRNRRITSNAQAQHLAAQAPQQLAASLQAEAPKA